MKIILADSEILFREKLKEFIELNFDFQIIGEASNSFEFLKLQNINDADIILMDLKLSGKNGYETAFETTFIYRNAKIIALMYQHDYTLLTSILQSGFKAIVFRECVFEEIIPIVKSVQNNEYHIPESIKI